MAAGSGRTAQVLQKYENELLRDWLAELKRTGSDGRIAEADLQAQARQFLQVLRDSARHGSVEDLSGPEWAPVRDFLGEVSRTRVAQGFAADETATFIFSLKRPLFARLGQEAGGDAKALADEVWSATELLDRLGLHTVRRSRRRARR